MIASRLTDNDSESKALEAHALVIGRCDRVAPATGRWAAVRTASDRTLSAGVRARTYEALGSITTDTGGNAP